MKQIKGKKPFYIIILYSASPDLCLQVLQKARQKNTLGVIEMNTTTIILIATTVVFALLNILSFLGGISYRRKIYEAELGYAEERAKKII